MASMRDIKRRVKSVNSTQQITKAMNLVASSKLTKAKTRMTSTLPFFKQTQDVIAGVVKGSNGISHPYLEQRTTGKTAILVITGDRGLCGGYNANVCKEALALADSKQDVTFITMGTKAVDFFKRRGYKISSTFRGFSEKPEYTDAQKIGRQALSMFASGDVDEVYLVYTEFLSTISSEPKTIKLLPVDVNDFEENTEKSNTLTIYEPNEEAVLEYVIPKYVTTLIYGALVESATCELSSRMTAMDSATENAKDMIDSLNLLYNRVRQGAITQEITEIVSGSNALE